MGSPFDRSGRIARKPQDLVAALFYKIFIKIGATLDLKTSHYNLGIINNVFWQLANHKATTPTDV